MTTVSDELYEWGGVPVGLFKQFAPAKVRMLAKAATNSYSFWQPKWPAQEFHTKISQAEAAMTTKRNEILLITPESHVWYGESDVATASLTWDKHNTHIVGMAPFSKGGGCRARFGHSGSSMASFMALSGSNNLLKNLYWMHGSSDGTSADLNLMTLTGHRNVFEGCHFGGPNDATQAVQAAYAQMIFTGAQQNYFKDCLFGGMNSVHRTGANTILKLNTGQNTNNVFENCVFWSRAAATTPYFINLAAAATTGGCYRAIFLNCQFMNLTNLHGSYDLAVGIKTTATEGDENYLYFDNRCSFAGITHLIADNAEEMIWWGGAGANSDTTGIGDDIALGLAQHYNYV